MSIKVAQAPFNIEVLAGGRPKVSREIVFTNGDKISFEVSLEQDGSLTMGDLHRKSVEEVIKRLENFAPPKKPA